ncbi:formyltransferase family protein [Plantactinospora sp. DSM 117369]
MTAARRYRCWLVGYGSLLAGCGEILLRRGHRIAAVISRAGAARDWATEHGIACFDTIARVTAARPDHLFSIVNPDVLSAAELATPCQLAINFHSSPLPRYAGVHQTSWAIVNGETTYGVTWHLMTSQVDGGDMLAQRRFPVADDETTLTLGMKCHDHGLAAFEALLEDLETDRLRPERQDLSQRTYYPRRRRMPASGLVRWDRPAVEAERLCRAADLGAFDNPFGAPKILVRDRCVVLRRSRVSAGPGAPPGTVVALGTEMAQIATADGDLLVDGLVDLSGGEIGVGTWAGELNLSEGDLLPCPDSATLDHAERLSAWYGADEEYWAAQLATVGPQWLPVPRSERTDTLAVRPSVTTPLPGDHPSELDPCDESSLSVRLLAGWLEHAAQFGPARQTVWWSHPALRAAVGALSPLYATAVPVTVAAPDAASVGQALRAGRSHGTFPLDLPVRYPTRRLGDRIRPAVVFAVADGTPSLPPADLHVSLDLAAGRVHVSSHDDALRFAAAQVVMTAAASVAAG